MEPTSLTITAIITALIVEASKEAGKFLIQETYEKSIKIIETVRSRFKESATEGILNKLQENPSEINKSIFSSLLEEEIKKSPEFSKSLIEILKTMEHIDNPSSQKMFSEISVEGNIEVESMHQDSTSGSQTNQEMATNIKAKNIKIGNLSQKI